MTLHNEQQALRQAIEKGGYLAEFGALIPADIQEVQNDRGGAIYVQTNGAPVFLDTSKYLTDTAFWQALGRARKWDVAVHDSGAAMFSPAWEIENERARTAWQKHALDCISIRLNINGSLALLGGNMTPYWKSLP